MAFMPPLCFDAYFAASGLSLFSLYMHRTMDWCALSLMLATLWTFYLMSPKSAFFLVKERNSTNPSIILNSGDWRQILATPFLKLFDPDFTRFERKLTDLRLVRRWRPSLVQYFDPRSYHELVEHLRFSARFYSRYCFFISAKPFDFFSAVASLLPAWLFFLHTVRPLTIYNEFHVGRFILWSLEDGITCVFRLVLGDHKKRDMHYLLFYGTCIRCAYIQFCWW